MKRYNRVNLSEYGHSLPKEDRSFGGNDLYIDLIPSTSWFKNLRVIMPQVHWKELSRYIRERSYNQCEICGSDLKLEAHERWSFDKKTRIQKLERIMCLCKICHLSVHIGLAGIIGATREVNENFSKIKGWNRDDLNTHIKEAKEKFRELSSIYWEVDFSMIEDLGLHIYSKGIIQEKVNNKINKIKEEPFWLSSFSSLSNPAVFIPTNSKSMLGGFILEEGLIDYWVKENTEIPRYYYRTSLANFLKSYKKPLHIENMELINKIINENKNECNIMIITKNLQIDFDLKIEGFKKGIIFFEKSKN